MPRAGEHFVERPLSHSRYFRSGSMGEVVVLKCGRWSEFLLKAEVRENKQANYGP